MSRGAKITIAIVLVLVLLICGALLFMANSSSPATGSTGSAPAVGAPAVGAPAVGAPAVGGSFSCDQNAQNSAVQYYNTQGEWKGVFTMTPNRIIPAGAKQCDINYSYKPIPGNPRGRTDTGIDYRRFTYDDAGRAINMGGNHSGTLAA
jgi:hypothetical protein